MRKPLATIFISLGLALLALAAGALSLRKTVSLTVDGQERRLSTFTTTVGGLLRSQGLALGPNDILTPTLATRLAEGARITLERAVVVQILADGQRFMLVTTERQPARLLALTGLRLAPGDQLFLAGRPLDLQASLPRAAFYVLQLQRPCAFSLTVSDPSGAVLETISLSSSAPSLGQALWEAGLTLYAADRLTPSAETPLTPGLHADLVRAQPYTVQASGLTLALRSAAPTVGEALAEAGLSLQGLDYSYPVPGAALPANGLVRLVHVQEVILLEQTPVEFETQTVNLPDVELDTTQVVQAGEFGLLTQRVRVRYEDGVEVERVIEEEWLGHQSVPKIIGYGAKAVLHTTSTPDGAIQYYRALQFYATSYKPSDGGSITASGKPLRKGLVGVDPTYVPYGTRLYIPGYGFAEAADTGCINGRWIDLGYSDNNYVAWHQWVTVYFLWPPPAYVPVTIPPPSTCTGFTP